MFGHVIKKVKKYVTKSGLIKTWILACPLGKQLWAPRLLERKNNNKAMSFSELFFMFTLMWITEKELERVIENNIPFPCLAKHIALSKFWKIDLDRTVIW